MSPEPKRPAWLRMAEVGSISGILFVARSAKFFGRGVARFVVFFVASYFFLTSKKARDASRIYFERLGLEASRKRVFSHIRTFANVLLDRLFFLQSAFENFEFTHEGRQHLLDLHDRGQGALLLGAHFGSFEALRAQSVHYGIRVTVVAHFGNAVKINEVLRRFGGPHNMNFLDAAGEKSLLALRIAEAVERGDLVAILADRVHGERTVRASFLGREAAFPAGPYLLASALKCPVLLVTARHRAPNRYDLRCTPLADRIVLPRADRESALAGYAQKYADWLAALCRETPDNWFNFFDFWDETALREEARRPD